MRTRQNGMTMWSAAFVIGVAVFFLFLVFKLLPPYLEDLKVRTALEGVAREANSGGLTKVELVERLEKRFEIDNVTNVAASQLVMQSRGRFQVLQLNYEVVVPLAFNVSALLEFNHARQVSAAD